MRIIGLTGGIGSGKSTVSRFLSELGAVVIDLDKIGHRALQRGSQAWRQVVEAFGQEILASGGEIDRTKLGTIVFQDRAALLKLNHIMHPAIDAIVAEKIEEYRRREEKVVVLEAAAMIEADRTGQVEELWVTTTPKDTVMKRLQERSGYTAAEAEARIKSQLSDEERIRQADVIIDTECLLDELHARVKAEWDKLLKRI